MSTHEYLVASYWEWDRDEFGYREFRPNQYLTTTVMFVMCTYCGSTHHGTMLLIATVTINSNMGITRGIQKTNLGSVQLQYPVFYLI